MNKRLIFWIRKHLGKIAGAGMLALLAGCATVPPGTTSVNAPASGQITYAATCSGYQTTLNILAIFRGAGNLTPAEVSTVNGAATVFNSYCPPNSLPTDSTAAMAQMATAVLNVNQVLAKVSPTTPPLK